MKIQLDTNLKTIKLEEEINLGIFYSIIRKLLPDDMWKQYKLETGTVINNWINPIIIDTQPNAFQPYPWLDPSRPTWTEITPHQYLTVSGNTDKGVNNGVYCIEGTI